MRFSLTSILFPVMLFLASCTTTSIQQKEQLVLNLDLQTSNKNKEMIIEYLLKEDLQFSLDFDKTDSYKLANNILKSDLKYFCNSFIEEQNIFLESVVFNSSRDSDKKILIVYSDEFKNIAQDLKNKYPLELYFLIDEENYKNKIDKILGRDLSIEKHSNISSIDRNINIEHSPRIRNDISKMYFLINYDLGKTIVPIFRSSALNIDFYSSTQIFHNASNLKKLVDFENTNIPLSKKIIDNISNKKKIDSIENEFEKLLISDFLTIEKIYQNNLFKNNIMLETGPTQIRKNQCINRNLPIWKISSNSITNRS